MSKVIGRLFVFSLHPKMISMLDSVCIPAGHVGGGTLVAKCHATSKGPAPNAKVNGWGPFFANDR